MRPVKTTNRVFEVGLCTFRTFNLEGVEVPEARLSANDKTTDSDEVYFNTKHDCTVYTQVEIS